MDRILQRHRLFAMVAPLVVWALHLLVAYSLVGLHCGAPPSWLARIGAATLFWGEAVAAALALVALAALVRHGRSIRHDARGGNQPGERTIRESEHFVGWVLLLMNLLAALAIAFTVLPLLMLEPCR